MYTYICGDIFSRIEQQCLPQYLLCESIPLLIPAPLQLRVSLGQTGLSLATMPFPRTLVLLLLIFTVGSPLKRETGTFNNPGRPPLAQVTKPTNVSVSPLPAIPATSIIRAVTMMTAGLAMAVLAIPPACWHDETPIFSSSEDVSSACQDMFPDYEKKKTWHLAKRHSAYNMCSVKWPSAPNIAEAINKDTCSPKSRTTTISITSSQSSVSHHKKDSNLGSLSLYRNTAKTKRQQTIPSSLYTLTPGSTRLSSSLPIPSHFSSISPTSYRQRRKISTHSHLSTVSSQTLTSSHNPPTPTLSLSSSPIKRRLFDGFQIFKRKISFVQK